MSAACLMMAYLEQTHIIGENSLFLNADSGEDITIRETVESIAGLVGCIGESVCNDDQTDGTPLNSLKTRGINDLGWKPRFSFGEGLASNYLSCKSEIAPP